MENTAQSLIISQQLVSSGSEQEISDKLKEIVHERNTQGIPRCQAIASMGFANISSICVGPQHIAVLRKDGQICRFTTLSKIHQVQPSTAAPSQGNNPGGPSQASNRNNLPKFRRVMLSASSFDRFRRGERVLIDRGRPMLPASSVPEDLIAQAQVVLQGKSREVIVRELQRTNLNVNEAVNNLLSRDDDEDDFPDGGEVVLPEELLSLLSDSTGPHPIMEGDMYGGDFEYVLHRDMARRRAEKEKEKKTKDATPPVTAKSRWELDDVIEWWNANNKGMPNGVKRFIMMTATASELLAVADTGDLYGWPWLATEGSELPHKHASALLPANDPIVQISSSRLRVMVLLRSGQIATWLDPLAIGERVFMATEVKPLSLALSQDENVIQLVVSDHLAVARTSFNSFYWLGLYPANERPKMWEKERNRSKKHVTFDTGFCDIKEGSEVRTKAFPIYAAGSVALNFNLVNPMIGVLMESVWTLTEVVRFRLLSPAEYDRDYPSSTEEGPSTSSNAPPEGSRKRRAQDEIFEQILTKEEAWNVCDVIWIHEQQNQDVATVRIVDGAYVGVEYTPGKNDMTFASSLSGTVSAKDTGASNPGRMRLMRKDELCLVTPKMKSARSPKVIQKEPLKFIFNGASARKVLSAVAESTGIRALTEKRGKLYITRCSIDGKIHSEHLLPVYPPALFGPGGEPPCLVNYGEDGLLILVDGNGSVHPLARDSTMGFREPQALNLPQVVHFGLFIEVGSPMLGKSSPTRKMAMVAMTGPKEEAADNEIPSLTQLIMFCDTMRMQQVLSNYTETNEDLARDQIVGERSDYGSNIIHTAVRLSVALKNRDDADPGMVHGIRLREEEIKMARDEARDLDQRWQRLIRANRTGEPPSREEPSVIQAAPMQDNAVQSPGDSGKSQEPPILERQDGVVEEPKERQRKSIEMIALILKHPAVQPYLYDLLTHRDYGGLTPFQAALNIRAYGAASIIWDSVKELAFPPPESHREIFKLSTMIFPNGSRQDDNPLFLLCYNDTCSFTWTGEEHINQDIFECRTCGLTGSLCCCTECAYTCHRNHDCKLKRTSPTAYCDCWEKCPCKALIAGNQDKREVLLKELLAKTGLFNLVNGKGEHLMLYLARTWGRQQTEQANSNKKRRQPTSTHADPAVVPEHDLEPPKFAKFALEACLTQWSVIKSLIEVGCRRVETIPPFSEDVLFLNSQSGSTHLDKFVFILLSKCGDVFINQFLDAIVTFSKGEGPSDDPRFFDNIGRLSRSVVRMYIMLMLMSPNAASVGIKGKSPYGPIVKEPRQYSASFSASGLFQIVRPSEHAKESKQHNLVNVILRCREILFRLAPHSAEHVTFFADSMLAPMRFGIIRPSINVQLQSSHDPLDTLEKFLNNEMDLSSNLTRYKYESESRERNQRKRKPSRREEHEEDDQNRRDYSEESDDSEADEPPSSRRYNSQSGNEPPPTEAPRRKPVILTYDDELTDPGSSSSDSDPSDEEPEAHVLVDDDVEDEDTEEDDHDERYGENSEGDDNQNYEDGDDQRNDNDFPSPTYEPTESEERFQNRDQEMAEIPPPGAQEEDDNTRDAVHSEDSTNDNPEPTREDPRNIPNDQEAPSTSRSNDREIRRRHDTGAQRFSMSWTSRRSVPIAESEDDTDERNNSRAPPSTQNNTGAATSPSDQSRKTSNDNPPSILITYQQLALGFDFSIRILCELLAHLYTNKGRMSQDSLSCNEDYFNSLMQRISMTLSYSWDYMSIVMDRLEAQLRFSNSITTSGVPDFRLRPRRLRDPKKDKNNEDVPSFNSKKDTMDFLMSNMRSYGNETGDDYPIIDMEIMHHLVYLLDAYISFHETVNSSKQNLAVWPEYLKRKQTVNRFFQRSNSMSFPGSMLTDAWDTLDKTQGRVPYAERPNLLTQEVDPATLFAPPSENYNWVDYADNCRKHGIPNIMDMNLGSLEQSVRQQFPMDTQMNPYQDATMDDIKPPAGMERFTLEEVRAHLANVNDNFIAQSLARWKHIIQHMGKECHHEIVAAFGGEIQSNHILSLAGNFSIRQGIFRKAMDKFRGQQTKDIAFDVHRDSIQLIRDAVFQLNQTYVRRLNTPKGRDDPTTNTPLGSGRVKVRFFDEPGEGTGVARSFYTALAEALMNTRKFPFDNPGWDGEDYLYGNQNMCSTPQSSSRDRSGAIGRIAVIRDRSSMSAMVARAKRATKQTRTPLSADSEPFSVEDINGAIDRLNIGAYKTERVSDVVARKNPVIAEAIYIKVRQVRPAAAARIAGMLVDTPVSVIVHILSSPDLFKQYVEDAVSILLSKGKPADLALLADQKERPITEPNQPHPPTDDAPLFAKTSRRGLYAPVPGKMSPMRLNAFRNVGRIIGLCLSQGELFPLKLSRHVLKYILNRPLRWLDLQFYDPFMWESLRQLMNYENNEEYYSSLDLTFSAQITVEEADGTSRPVIVPLKDGGEDIPVTRENVVEYVYKFVELKLLGPDHVQCYSAIRQGVSDVILMESLEGLTPEDLRLLLCGAETICMTTLQAVTTFSDESHATSETLDKFKCWFWSVVDGLSSAEKQDLIFFWTGSPSLPTSPENLQPQPTVMIRPPDDLFLPTANTCISRLYVPLYSSKKLLRSKLQLAIKAKNFGFV